MLSYLEEGKSQLTVIFHLPRILFSLSNTHVHVHLSRSFSLFVLLWRERQGVRSHTFSSSVKKVFHPRSCLDLVTSIQPTKAIEMLAMLVMW